jgi:hypothetical protein
VYVWKGLFGGEYISIDAVIPMRNPVARYQRRMVAGSAMIYRTRCVKLNSRKKFPRKPQIKDAMLKK